MIRAMARLQVDLPERLKAAAEQRAAAGGYESVDSYIASLIEADGVAPITDEMEAELLKGLDSGPAVEITPEFLTDLKRRARAGRGSAA
jgi:hypothetical protein